MHYMLWKKSIEYHYESLRASQKQVTKMSKKDLKN